jgi:hypothetical protein
MDGLARPKSVTAHLGVPHQPYAIKPLHSTVCPRRWRHFFTFFVSLLDKPFFIVTCSILQLIDHVLGVRCAERSYFRCCECFSGFWE